MRDDRFVLTGGSVHPVAFDDVVERMLQAGGAGATGTYDSSEMGHERVLEVRQAIIAG